MTPERCRPEWVKSSRCDSVTCVEVKVAGQGVCLRNSDRPNGIQLAFSGRSWSRFLQGVKLGTINQP